MEDIRKYHAECFNYLVQYCYNNKGVYFVPRKKNKYNRLDLGYYFIGNDEYMMITFWDGGDRHAKVHNINFGIKKNGQCYIDISSKDKEERGIYLEKLVEVLERDNTSSLKTNYREINHYKWVREYDVTCEGMSVIDILQDFIDNEKPIIDKFITDNPECGIKIADEELYSKYVLKLLEDEEELLKNNGEVNAEILFNKSGEVLVNPHAYHMKLKHNELQNALLKYLIQSDEYENIEKEKNNVDISAISNGEKIFFELKTDIVKSSIRQAIGQLLEYNHYPDTNNADKLIIVTKFEATKSDKKYLKFIRERYNIPIYYQMFDMDNNTLSEEF